MKKLLAVLMLLAGVAAPAGALAAPTPAGLSPAPTPAGLSPTPRILLDGVPLELPVAPVIRHGRTLVPFRAIAEALGVAVAWNPELRRVEAAGMNRSVVLAIGERTALVDGEPVALDVPPAIVAGRTLIPLRFFAQAFHAGVHWDAATQTVVVVSPVREMETLAFYAIASFAERDYVARFSAVAFGWAELRPDGRVDLAGAGEYRWPEPAGEITGERLVAGAARAGTQTYLMVRAGDARGELTRLVLDEKLRETAAAAVAAAVRERGFDGALLDLEGLGLTEAGEELARVRAGFTRLVQQTAQALHAAGKRLIVSLHPPNGAYHGYDFPAVAAAADRIQLMAHDYVQDGAPEPTEKVQEAILLTLAQVPAGKVLLGILAPVETPATLAEKAGLAKRYGLAGVSLWRLGLLGPERLGALEGSVRSRKGAP